MVPRCVQEGPRWLLYDSLGGQDRSKESQDGSRGLKMHPRRHKKGARGLQELHLDPPGLQFLGKNSKDFNNFIKPVLRDKV